MKCPKCRRAIPFEATSHACGWNAVTELVPRCAHETCANPAIIRTRVTPHAWSDFCESHYMAHHQARAEASCARLGLDTLAKKLAWLRENKFLAKRAPAAGREPGQDEA